MVIFMILKVEKDIILTPLMISLGHVRAVLIIHKLRYLSVMILVVSYYDFINVVMMILLALIILRGAMLVIVSALVQCH